MRKNKSSKRILRREEGKVISSKLFINKYLMSMISIASNLKLSTRAEGVEMSRYSNVPIKQVTNRPFIQSNVQFESLNCFASLKELLI